MTMVGYQNSVAAEMKQRNKGGAMSTVLKPQFSEAYSSPRPASKVGVSSKARENLERSRGSMGDFLDSSKNVNYMSPRGAPRVNTGESQEIYKKNQGQMSTVMNVNSNRFYYTPRAPKLSSGEGKENYEKGKHGTMKFVMDLDKNREYSSPRPQPRIKSSEGQDIMEKSNGKVMSRCLDVEANRGYSSARPAPRVPQGAAQEIAHRHSGCAMSRTLDNDANRGYCTPRKEPRVKAEAAENAEKDKGRMMDLVLRGKAVGEPQPAKRVSREAEDIYSKSRGTLGNMQANYGRLPLSARPAPRIKGEGESVATSGQKGTLCHLLNKYGELPKSPRPASRVRPEAKRWANKNKGTMDSVMNPNPRVKKRSSGRKSAAW